MTAALATTLLLPSRSAPLHLQLGLFINNIFLPGRGTPLTPINPSHGTPLLSHPLTVQSASPLDVDLAVIAARQCFKSTWGLNLTGFERSRLISKLADLVERDLEDLSLVESLDSGKPIAWARGDVKDAVACLRYYAGWADKIIGQSLEGSSRKQCFTRHEPMGVVAQIVPWNYPIMMWAWKVGPALAVGCTIIFKPAENTPLSTLKLASLFVEAGFPPGVFNVVNGLGSETGAALSAHPGIDKIAFTGSTATGRAITIAAAQSNLKRVSLELGGKSANIIFPSADLDQAVKWSVLGVFENAGQSCSAGSRVLVHRSILKEFEERIKTVTESIIVGDPLSETTWQGPQISEVQYLKILNYIQQGLDDPSAVLLTGGSRWTGPNFETGYFIQPTIFTNVNPHSKIAKEEIFGPMLVIIPFDTEEEAIELANDSMYGLAAAVHSQLADQIGRVSGALEAGTVWINQYTFTANNVPFGGYKSSGWGRELGSYALEEYVNVKSVHWNYGEKIEFNGRMD